MEMVGLQKRLAAFPIYRLMFESRSLRRKSPLLICCGLLLRLLGKSVGEAQTMRLKPKEGRLRNPDAACPRRRA